MNKRILLCQPWSVKENGRPSIEGEYCSLHENEKKRQEFIRLYWAKMPEKVPDSYACLAENPKGKAIPAYECSVDAATYDRVVKSGIGMWCTTVPQKTVDAVSIVPPRDLVSLVEGLMSA